MIGKIIGGIIGFMMGGPLLALLGLWIGHLVDKKRRLAVSPEQFAEIQRTFFETVFLLLGHVAKADGRISEAEVAATQELMTRMGLTAEHKRDAIRLFKQGAEPGFDVESCLARYRAVCGRRSNLAQMLLVNVINLAIADGAASEGEVIILRKIALGIGFSNFAFEQIIKMVQAQNQFRQSYQQQSGAGRSDAPTPDRLTSAYDALGVDKSVSDAELKKAWRKLMSQYHPDKLTGQGLPDDMVKEATERSQEIQAAYDLIKKSRGLK